MAVHRFDSANGRDVTGLLKGEDLDVQSVLNALDEPARFAALIAMIEKVRCEAAACCAEAKASADVLGDVVVLTTDDDLQELNHATPDRMGWDRVVYNSGAYTVAPGGGSIGRVTIPATGLYRIKAQVTYTSAVVRASLGVHVSATGLLLDGVGRQGYVRNNNGHIKSTSDTECWSPLVEGDYIDVLTEQNGAAGVVNVIPGESILVVERRPYVTGGQAT